MTATKLIEMLQRWRFPDAQVLVYDADSGKSGPVTGSVLSADGKSVELFSDSEET